MNIRKCKICRVVFPATKEFFYAEKTARWGVAYRCKLCDNRRREFNRAKVRSDRKKGPCADCGQTFPPCAMSFDHLPGYEKKFAISQSQLSEETVRAEIEKCDLVCLNCHAVRTWTRAKGSSKE